MRIICIAIYIASIVLIYNYRAIFITQIQYNLIQKFLSRVKISRKISDIWARVLKREASTFPLLWLIFHGKWSVLIFPRRAAKILILISLENATNSLETWNKNFFLFVIKIQRGLKDRSFPENLPRNLSSPSYWTLDVLRNDENSTVLEFLQFSSFFSRPTVIQSSMKNSIGGKRWHGKF